MIFCAKTITEVYSFEKHRYTAAAVMLSLSMLTGAAAADYSDLKPHWAEQAMEFAVQSNLMDGISGTHLCCRCCDPRLSGAGAVPHGARACS